MLAYRRLGIDEAPVRSMLATIQGMKHHIRTSYGDSEMALDGKGNAQPFQGILQSNGASPTTWVIISTPILNMIRQSQHGGFFIETISGCTSHSVGYSFVDDTDLLEYKGYGKEPRLFTVMTNMQENINRWEGGIKLSGGAIVPHKSWVYPI